MQTWEVEPPAADDHATKLCSDLNPSKRNPLQEIEQWMAQIQNLEDQL